MLSNVLPIPKISYLRACEFSSGEVLENVVNSCSLISHSSACSSSTKANIDAVVQSCSDMVAQNSACDSSCSQKVDALNADAGLADCVDTHEYIAHSITIVRQATTMCDPR